MCLQPGRGLESQVRWDRGHLRRQSLVSKLSPLIYERSESLIALHDCLLFDLKELIFQVILDDILNLRMRLLYCNRALENATDPKITVNDRFESSISFEHLLHLDFVELLKHLESSINLLLLLL